MVAAAVLGGGYAGAYLGRFALRGGDTFHSAVLFLLGAFLVRLFTALFRKAVSPSEILSFLFLLGVLILWD